ncbi:MAG: serine protease [Patescibacteria group bacterium]
MRQSIRIGVLPFILGILAIALPTYAAELPFYVRQAVVKVFCGDYQGSGVVVNSTEGYVLTNGHIALDIDTLKPHDDCEIAFLAHDGSTLPSIFYSATPVKYVYDESQNRDFAVLKIMAPEGGQHLSQFPMIKTDEFSKVGDPLSIVGYPGTSNGRLAVTNGTISGLNAGIIVSKDAVIAPGNSGGAGLDADNNLIGLATRILLREVSPGVEEVVDYELVDIRAIEDWLNTFGAGTAELYVTHADPVRYQAPTTYVSTGNLSCSLLARSPIDSTVYCLKNDGTRSVFPNDDVYYTWFSDFSGVQLLQPQELAPYRVSNNVPMKPGTLIKIQTDPKVYLVTDLSGTIRWVETETRARELFGDGWAGFVRDVPDTFFTGYHIGSPIL